MDNHQRWCWKTSASYKIGSASLAIPSGNSDHQYNDYTITGYTQQGNNCIVFKVTIQDKPHRRLFISEGWIGHGVYIRQILVAQWSCSLIINVWRLGFESTDNSLFSDHLPSATNVSVPGCTVMDYCVLCTATTEQLEWCRFTDIVNISPIKS